MEHDGKERAELLDLLRGSARAWTVRELSRKSGIRPQFKVQEILLDLQRKGQVSLVHGTRWKATGAVRTASRSIPQTKPHYPSVGDGSVLKHHTTARLGDHSPGPAAGSTRRGTGRFAGSRWAEFRSLCLYYADCVRLEQGTNVKSYADRENDAFLCLCGRYDWRGISAGKAFLIEATEQHARFFRRVAREGAKGSLLLGGPVNVHLGTDRKSGESYTVVSPLFVVGLAHQFDGGNLVLAADGHVGVNHGWLEYKFSTYDERRSFLELCGLDQPASDEPERVSELNSPGFPELFASTGKFYEDWWKEAASINALSDAPAFQALTESGIYNRMILLAAPKQKYTAGLHRELIKLAQEVPDENLDQSALPLLFPHIPRRAESKTSKTMLAKDTSGASSPKPDADTVACLGETVAEVELLNANQRLACHIGLTAPLGVITGPPGTGKSRVVANTMANHALRGQSVLFASRNHQAIEAVEPKLNAMVEPDTVVLRLSQPFGQETSETLPQILNLLLSRPQPLGILAERHQAVDDLGAAEDEAAELDESMRRRFHAHAEFTDAEWKLGRVLLEFPDIEAIVRELPDVPSSSHLLVYADLYRAQEPQGWLLRRLLLGLARWWRRRREFPEVQSDLREMARVFSTEVLGGAVPDRPTEVEFLQKLLDRVILLARAVEHARTSRRIRSQLDDLPTLPDLHLRYHGQKKRLVDCSRDALRLTARCFGAELAGHEKQKMAEIWAGFQNHREFGRFQKAVHDSFGVLLRHIPLWATTNLSAARGIPLAPGVFDLLIIDEASQCDIASVIPLMFRCRRVLVVGDPMQLPHVSQLSKDVDWRLRKTHALTETRFERFSHRVNSFFQLAATSANLNNDHHIQLREHHRSHPAIAAYCNRSFYNETLEVMTNTDRLTVPRRGRRADVGIRWTHVDSDVVAGPGGGAISAGQMEAVIAALRELSENRFGGSVGIVSPFRQQVNRIRDRVTAELGPEIPTHWRLLVDTADGFQGDERDVILFSLVGGPDMPRGAQWFYQNNPNRFNVAVSRARALLHVFGDLGWARQCGGGLGHVKLLAEAAEAEMPSAEDICRPDLIGPVWEPRLAQALKGAGIPFVQQYPACGRYLDFALLREGKKLDIEVDGEQYHRQPDGRRVVEDLHRDLVLTASGWQVLRFWVYELREDMAGCVEKIRREWEADPVRKKTEGVST